MKKQSSEKTLLNKLFKQEPKPPPKAEDIQQVVKQEQNTTKHIKELADHIQHSQHKAAVGAHDLVSQLKHLKRIEKQRQKLTNDYIKQQRTDPSLSPLKIVQTITQDTDSLPPYSETATTPTAPIYPEIHQVHNISAISDDPFTADNLENTIKELAIPSFDPSQPLDLNRNALETEVKRVRSVLITQAYDEHTDLIQLRNMQKQSELLTQLLSLLPSLYATNTIFNKFCRLQTNTRKPVTPPRNLVSPLPTTPPSPTSPFSNYHDRPQHSNQSDMTTPFSQHTRTPKNLLMDKLQLYKLNTKDSPETWEYQLNKLQDDIVSEYAMLTSDDAATKQSLLLKFSNISTIIKQIHSLYQHKSLSQLNQLPHDSSDIWSAAHLFDVTSSKTQAESRSILGRHIQRLSTILKKIEQHADSSLYQHVNTKLQYLNKLQLHLSHAVRSHSEGFEPSQLAADPASPNFLQPPTQPIATTSHNTRPTLPKPVFYPEVNNTRSIPKDLLSILDSGDEIQWARLTQATLEEFPNIDEKLKLKALTRQLTQHPAAKQAAMAQLLQSIQDPTHNPLQGFFTWIFQSYRLTPQEQNAKLRQAIEQQKFDWTTNPAIDLQTAISQVHMTLSEINNNEIFRDTLKDALKFKLQPHYHLVADTPIPDLPERLRFIWKNIAVPKPTPAIRKETSQPIILHTQAQPDSKSKSQKQNSDSQQIHAPKGQHPLAKQIQDIHQHIKQVHQIQNRPNYSRQILPRASETRTCYRCNTPGHISKNCRKFSNNNLDNNRNFSPSTQRYSQDRGRSSNDRPYNRYFNNNSRQNHPRNRPPNFHNQQQIRYFHNNRFPNQTPRQPNNQTFFQHQPRTDPTPRPRNPNQTTNFNRPPVERNTQKRQPLPTSAAEHAERNFPPKLSASQRWSQETKRPPFPYAKAMAELATAQHFEVTPEEFETHSYDSNPPTDHFLEQDPDLQSSPT